VPQEGAGKRSAGEAWGGRRQGEQAATEIPNL